MSNKLTLEGLSAFKSKIDKKFALKAHEHPNYIESISMADINGLTEYNAALDAKFATIDHVHDGYVTTSSLSTTLSPYAKLSAVNTLLTNYATKTDLSTTTANYVPVTGHSNLSGQFIVTGALSGGSLPFKHYLSEDDGGSKISFGVGSSGTKKGVYNVNRGTWMIYVDDSSDDTKRYPMLSETPPESSNNSQIATTHYVRAVAPTKNTPVGETFNFQGRFATIGDAPLMYFKLSGVTRSSSDNISEAKSSSIVFSDQVNNQLACVKNLVSTNGTNAIQLLANSLGAGKQSIVQFKCYRDDATLPEFSPGANSTSATTGINLGSSGSKWNLIYARTSTITTSDEREKSAVRNYTDEELDAWGEVNWCTFKMNDSIAEKGEENARIHSGLIAQRIQEIFDKHGLDATNYAFFCYDEWTNEIYDTDPKTGEIKSSKIVEGSGYALRYSECFAIESAYQRRRADLLETRLAALEAKVDAILGE